MTAATTTRVQAPPAARRGPFAALLRSEARLFRREPVNLVLILALPAGLIAGFGLIPGFGDPDPGLGGQSGTQFIASLCVGIVIAALSLMVLPGVLGTYRERGVLKWMHTTPTRPAYLLGAQLAVYGAGVLTSLVLILGVAILGFGVDVPGDVPMFLVAILLGSAALLSVGLLVAAVASSAKAAQGIGMALFFPSMFLGGVYIPRDAFPHALQVVSDFTPLGATIEAVRASWQGEFPRPLHLGVLAVYAVGASLLAARTFRWE
jgi:ABC-2 type transport system permease protein